MVLFSDDDERLLRGDHPWAQVMELCWKARCAFNWSHLEEARRLALRALDLLLSEPTSSRTSLWDRQCRSEALHELHQLLGLIDLRNDDRGAAKEHLAASAHVESPFSAFGPSMLLAEALLKLGEREAVLDYFEACERLWRYGEPRLKVWAAEVREGRIPVFGFNRVKTSAHAPLCWELRRGDVVHGRLYFRMRHRAWFVCAFEPSESFPEMREHLQQDFRNPGGEPLDLESAYDRLQALDLVLYPGDGGRPVKEAVIQVDGDTACFRY